jgi:hypothetical protein
MNNHKVSTGLNCANAPKIRVAFAGIPQYGIDKSGVSVQVSGFREQLPDFNAQIPTDKMIIIGPRNRF